MEDKLSQEKKPIEIRITLPTNAYFLSGIRDFTLNLIKNMTKFEEKWAFRFQSIVDELCNNAIEHGSRPGESINIIFSAQPDKYIRVSVEDTGTGPNPMTAEELNQLISKRKADTSVTTMIRGRGLPKIVAQWTDELLVENNPNGGLKITALKNLDETEAKELTKQTSTTRIVLT